MRATEIIGWRRERVGQGFKVEKEDMKRLIGRIATVALLATTAACAKPEAANVADDNVAVSDVITDGNTAQFDNGIGDYPVGENATNAF